MEVLETGLTYKEYLKKIRASQFGWDLEEPTPITEGSKVKVEVKEEAPKKKITKKVAKKADE